MNNKILYLVAILLILSVFYFGQGCNMFTPAPTPTPVPTSTSVPTFTPVPSPTEDPKAHLIEPGKGLAYVEINKSDLTSVKKWLGETGKEATEKDQIKLIYENDKLTFWFTSKKQLLKAISIENNSYKTSEEIGLGSTVFKAQEKYPKGSLDLEKRIYFGDDGTDYYYDTTGEITKIYISDRMPVAKPTPILTIEQELRQSSYEEIANKVVDLLIKEDYKGVVKYLHQPFYPSPLMSATDEDMNDSDHALKVSLESIKIVWKDIIEKNGAFKKKLGETSLKEEVTPAGIKHIYVSVKCEFEKGDRYIEAEFVENGIWGKGVVFLKVNELSK